MSEKKTEEIPLRIYLTEDDFRDIRLKRRVVKYLKIEMGSYGQTLDFQIVYDPTTGGFQESDLDPVRPMPACFACDWQKKVKESEFPCDECSKNPNYPQHELADHFKPRAK